MVGSGPWHRDHTPPTRTHACSTHAQQARPRGRGKRLKWHRFTIFRALRAPSTATAPKKCLPESVFSGRTRKNFFARAGARAVGRSPMCRILHLVPPCVFSQDLFFHIQSLNHTICCSIIVPIYSLNHKKIFVVHI